MAKPSKVAANGARVGCEFCRHEVDHAALGHKLRQEREVMGVSQAEVARIMKTSPTMICDLEQGKRNWTPKMVERYQAAVTGIV